MLSQQTIETVQSTIPLLEQEGEHIIQHFYQNLLQDHQELRHIFNESNQKKGEQAKALAGAVLLYAKNITELDKLLPEVERIAHKHVSLGVKPEQYPIIGHALLSAIQEVAKLPADHPVLDSWSQAYGVLADVFIGAEESIYAANEMALGGWRGDREFTIADIIEESYNVKSFYLAPVDGKALPHFDAGQYIGIKLAIPFVEFQQIRQYSLSSTDDADRFRITVKADSQGLVSDYLHRCQKGTNIMIQAPTGVFKLDDDKQRHIFIAAGVGITPLMSMLQHALKKGVDPKDVMFIQSQHDHDSELFRAELAQLRQLYPFHYHCQITEGIEAHYVDKAKLSAWAQEAGMPFDEQTAVYFCGPKPFMSAMKRACEQLAVPEENCHYEVFAPTNPI